jgi:pimeloyl-ACP methyl ester carboxylesterase
VSARDRFVSINGLRLHVLEWDAAASSTVLLLHGGSAHAHWWDLFAEAIADRYRVLALDLRGHGDSEHAIPAAYRLADYAADLAALIEHLGLERVHLIGHSLGAMVATLYAGEHRSRVRSLAVVDSSLRISPAGVRYMVRLRNFPQPIYRDRERAIHRFRLLPTQTLASPAILAQVAAHALRALPDGTWTLKFDRESLAHTEPRDLTPILHRLTYPLLFVRGAHSTLLSSAGMSRLLHAAPRGRAVEIPAAHHHVMLDNPSAFAAALRDFLDACEISGTRQAP